MSWVIVFDYDVLIRHVEAIVLIRHVEAIFQGYLVVIWLL